MRLGRVRGVTALLLTAMLWGSSFPAIKVVVSFVHEATYTWVRSAIALAGLTPYVVYYHLKHGMRGEEVVNGLVTGIVYSVGLWLQGWGTRFTTASNSAFITGLNVVFVHLYEALRGEPYPLKALVSLLVSVAGLYLLTQPRGGLGIGEILVLISAICWAGQIVLVSRFSSLNPFVFTYYEMAPALTFIMLNPNLDVAGLEGVYAVLPLLAYLGLVCGNIAFACQVYGQRWLKPHEAALTLLLEPVFAAMFSACTLGERLSTLEVLGATLIMAGMIVAVSPRRIQRPTS